MRSALSFSPAVESSIRHARRPLTLWAGLLFVLACEVLLVAYAVAAAYGRGKLGSYLWLWRHRRHLAARRRLLRDEQTVPDREWLTRLTPVLDASAFGALTPLPNVGFRAWWLLAPRLV